MSGVNSVLRWPGSKWRIASWVTGFFPQHDCYVDLFLGSGALLFVKEPSPVEIVNDLDGNVVNLFRVMRERPDELAQALALTPYARDEYDACVAALQAGTGDDLERARQLVAVSQQAYGRKLYLHRSGWRFREVRGQSPLSKWQKLPEEALAAAERLAPVQIENQRAQKLLRRVNAAEVLIYADPPYITGSRTANSSALYAHEMGDVGSHTELLEGLLGHVGPVVVSHYPHELYNDILRGWHTVETTARAQSNEHRTERLYINPAAWRALERENIRQTHRNQQVRFLEAL